MHGPGTHQHHLGAPRRVDRWYGQSRSTTSPRRNEFHARAQGASARTARAFRAGVSRRRMRHDTQRPRTLERAAEVTHQRRDHTPTTASICAAQTPAISRPVDRLWSLLIFVQLASERRFERVATDRRFRCEAEVSARAPARPPKQSRVDFPAVRSLGCACDRDTVQELRLPRRGGGSRRARRRCSGGGAHN